MEDIYELTTNKIIELAKEDKNKDKIDATIGMFFSEGGSLNEFKIINKIIKRNINKKTKAYGEILNDKEFKKSLIRYLFDKEVNEIECGYTMGATGALSFLFSRYCVNKRLIVPSIRWRNYNLIAKENNIRLIEYNLIKEEAFDIDNFLFVIEKEMLIENEINVLINDPCHNPTGYSLNAFEKDKIFSFFLKNPSKCKINLIIDIAYIDYSKYKIVDMINDLKRINDNINVFFTFSFSKSFGLYGYRGGACLLFSNNIKERINFLSLLKKYCRSIWSSCNNLLMESFKSINQKKLKVNREIDLNKKILLRRAKLLLDYFKKEDINTYPYEEGFFIFVRCNNSLSICKDLTSEHIYLIPYKEGIRISIASLPLNKTGILVKKLKKHILKNSKISVHSF